MPRTQMKMDVDRDTDAPVEVRSLGSRHATKFIELVNRQQELKREIEESEKERSRLSTEIMSLMVESGYKRIVTPDYKVTFTTGRNSHISKTRLLELGVKAETIAKATTERTYEYPHITPVKE